MTLRGLLLPPRFSRGARFVLVGEVADVDVPPVELPKRDPAPGRLMARDTLVARCLAAADAVWSGALVRLKGWQGFDRVRQMLAAIVGGDTRCIQLVVERPERDHAPVDRDLRAPSTRLRVPPDATVLRGCAALRRQVLLLLGPRDHAEIRPAIVPPIVVDVVDEQAVARSEGEQFTVQVNAAAVAGASDVPVLANEPAVRGDGRLVGRVDQGVPDDLAAAVVKGDA